MRKKKGTYQKGLFGFICALNAFGVKLSLLKTAMHDADCAGYTSLEVLEGGGWKAHLELVAQNFPEKKGDGAQGRKNNRQNLPRKSQLILPRPYLHPRHLTKV